MVISTEFLVLLKMITVAKYKKKPNKTFNKATHRLYSDNFEKQDLG